MASTSNEFNGKRSFDQVSSSSSEEINSGFTTAATSAIPTPIAEALPLALKVKLVKPVQPKKKKIKFGAGGNEPSTAQSELTRRRDNFLRAHADVYLPLLPEKNFVNNLLNAAKPETVFRDSVPYKKLAQPTSIIGGTMKEYQLSGLSFLAYMYENGQNCILADE